MIGAERVLSVEEMETLMDGVHDLGGREGFGPIVDKADDKPFHADWEMRAFGMKQASAADKSWTIDWFRHSRGSPNPIALGAGIFDR